ncbi:MAG: hypothetical protein ABWJ97_06785 [Thermoproteus sp.]
MSVSIYINSTPVASGATPLPFKMPILDVGTYNITIVASETANTTRAAVTRYLKVLPAPVRLNVYVNGTPLGQVLFVSYGQLLAFNILASSTVPPRGNAFIVVDGEKFGAVLDTLNIGAGVHNLSIVFMPSGKDFAPAAVNSTLVVAKSAPTLTAPRYVVTTYGTAPTATIGLFVYGRPVSGVVTVAVANYTEEVQVHGNTTIILPKLPAGTYQVLVSFPGNKDLYQATTSFLLVVQSARTTVVVQTPPRSVYGSAVPISAYVTPQVPGTISIFVNGTLIYNGQGPRVSTSWLPPRGGHFNITAVFQSLSSNYSNSMSYTIIYVEKANCNIAIQINSSNIYVLRKYYIIINSSVVPKVYIDGKYIGAAAVLPVVFNATGPHEIYAVFSGDERYRSCNSSLLVEAAKNPSAVAIETQHTLVMPNSPLGLIIDIHTNSYIVNGNIIVLAQNIINKNNYTFIKYINNSKNIVYIFLPSAGSYVLRVYYEGNPYTEGNYSNAVAVTVVEGVLGVPLILVASYGAAAVSAYAIVLAIKIIRRRSLRAS